MVSLRRSPLDIHMKVLAILIVVSLACPLNGCAAAKKHGDIYESRNFSVGFPGAGWRVVDNRNVGGTLLLGFRHVEEPVDIRVREIGLSRLERELPFNILVEILVRNYGRSRGFHTRIDKIRRIDIGDHEALAVFGIRGQGAVERRFAQIFLRAGGRMVVLSYITKKSLYNRHVVAYEQALRSFGVTLPENPPEIALPTPGP